MHDAREAPTSGTHMRGRGSRALGEMHPNAGSRPEDARLQ